MNQKMSVRKSISESGSWLIYALQRTEPKRVAAVVVTLVVRHDVVMRSLPEFEGDALVLQELGERLAIFRPDLRDVTLTSRSIQRDFRSGAMAASSVTRRRRSEETRRWS